MILSYFVTWEKNGSLSFFISNCGSRHCLVDEHASQAKGGCFVDSRSGPRHPRRRSADPGTTRGNRGSFDSSWRFLVATKSLEATAQLRSRTEIDRSLSKPRDGA